MDIHAEYVYKKFFLLSLEDFYTNYQFNISA